MLVLLLVVSDCDRRWANVAFRSDLRAVTGVFGLIVDIRSGTWARDDDFETFPEI